MNNILTIDLEEWFHANYNRRILNAFDENTQVRVIDNTLRLLDYFSIHGHKATFFVLGYIAEKHPDLIKEIYERGHEIASHGYVHELIYKQTRDEFKYDVQKSIVLIEDIINSKVIGYRAPSWSINSETLWALKVLEELGLVYDASIFPIKTYLYGIPTALRFTHVPQYNGSYIDILEMPMSTIRIFNKNIPFSGGAYFRVLPYCFIKYCINILNKRGNPALIYLHPREIDEHQPKLKLDFIDYMVHYTGIKGCENKLIKLLKDFRFTSIQEYYGLGSDDYGI